MSDDVRIFLSYDEAEARLAGELKQHIQTAFAGRKVIFWERTSNALDERARQSFLDSASLSLVIFSSTYLLKGENLLELGHARRIELEKRPKTPLYLVMAEPAVLPADLAAYATLPHPNESIEHAAFPPARQMQRVAAYLKNLEARTAGAPPQRPPYEKPYKPADLRERLTLQLERLNLSTVFSTLKTVVDDATLKQVFFELEDAWVEGIQACRLHRELHRWHAHNAGIKEELRVRIGQIESLSLIPAWRKHMNRIERDAQPGLGIFVPAGTIHAPQHLHQPAGPSEPELLGTLNATQQQEYRRNLLLCQDALAVGNPERAFALAEHLRTHINPLSAQLYEYLLISYLQKEGADRIVHDVLYEQGRKFRHIVLYASRLRMYNEQGHCPTDSGMHNCAAVAEELSDAMHRAYDALPNDHILDTGLRAVEVADARPVVARMLFAAQELFRAVHPFKGVLKTLVNELGGGGKSTWIERMEISNDGRRRFVPADNFDMETTMLEILEQLRLAEPEQADLLRFQLREDIYYNLLEKRQTLSRQSEWEQKRYRKLTDERLSVVRLIQSTLLCFQIFGDRGNDPEDQSFLRLAIEYLLPGLLLEHSPAASPDRPAYPLPMRWFDLDENGQLRPHPDNNRLRFDAMAIVERIVGEQAGHSAWLHIKPNLLDEVWKQYVQDTDAEYAYLRDNRQYQDVRRLDDVEVRRAAIQCLRRWMIAYRANPTAGSVFLDNILQELLGNRLLLWFYLNPAELQTHPDSLALGYDARAVLKELLALPISTDEVTIRKTLGANLFVKTIEPAYRQIPPRDGTRRENLVFILLQALHVYRDMNPDPVYLKLVFDELTLETKLPWIEVGPEGKPRNLPVPGAYAFDAFGIVEMLCAQLPSDFSIAEARRRIAARRFAELMDMYHREISTDRRQNGLPERRIALEIIRGMKALFYFYPDNVFLELPLDELNGKGQIRWQIFLANIFPIPQNHPENQMLQFDYKQEVAELKALRNHQQQWMQHLLSAAN